MQGQRRSKTRLVSALCLLLGVWLLSSCVSTIKQGQQPSESPAVSAADYPSDLQGARLYRIAAQQSKLHILVYRGGTMAQLGHNHVLSSASVTGYVWFHDSLSRCGFTLTLPINELIVDDTQARDEEGADFTTKVTDAARAGTKTNLLKPEQLDGEHYPLVRLRSLSIGGAREQPEVRVQITIKDQAREITVPAQLTRSDTSLRATGQFQIKLTDFGITPYSVALGALLVQDQLTIKFDLVALPM